MLLLCQYTFAQHKTTINANFDANERVISVNQELTYTNTSSDTLQHIILNDWNNAYSSKITPMAKRFTDEFIKAFHLAKDADRGSTTITNIKGPNNELISWSRPDTHPDLVLVPLTSPLLPGKSVTLQIDYSVKIPNDRFTRFGYNTRTGNYNLRDWYLAPARYEHGFIQNSNENLDDIANAATDYTLKLSISPGYKVYCDLDKTNDDAVTTYTGNDRMGFNLIAEQQPEMEENRFAKGTVYCNLNEKRLSSTERSIAIDKIKNFVSDNLGSNAQKNVMVLQTDYDRNPIYGLNQLPSFIRPFPDSFIYELKFLKTYTNAVLKNTLKLDPRKDSWVYNFMEMALVIKYIDENYPEEKLMGLLGNIGLLQGHHLFNIKQNEQYLYVYLLMARKNLDQALGDPKNTFIKFNEQIANKYKTAQAVKYLDSYLGDDVVATTVKDFFIQSKQTVIQNRNDLELLLCKKTGKDVSWFFNYVIDSRDVIDYKVADIDKTKDAVTVTLKNVSGTAVPVSLYGMRKKDVVFKQWLEPFTKDTTLTLPRLGADRIAINYIPEMPEYNPRNNTRSLKAFHFNRPVKFSFFQDIENPNYNQVFYVPAFSYNLYDGLSPGLRLHNKTLLEKPFTFDINGLYSPNTQQTIGSLSVLYNQYIRNDGPLYNIRYSLSANTYHYTPDARYYRLVPTVQFRMRPNDYRKNQKEFITFRQVMVDRRPSAYVPNNSQTESYSVFNARYSYVNTNISHHNNFNTDVQVSNMFGRMSGEYQYRHLFNDNRQVNLRFFAGAFMYRDTNNDFFSFGLDRASDYLFDYNYYGRSETTGLFSQQFIMADGGFKSILPNRYVNQWMTTVNGSFNIWNWVELYGDAGLVKSKYRDPRFVYDSGVRLNLVTDYFELYFPVYSSNGFEPSQGNYSQKIRFVVTLSPGTLLSLFTRKWF
ncbi:MAG: aminopeptidase [Bacteroidia bacterium]